MGTQVTLVYSVTPVGTTAAVLAALIDKAVVPLPKAILDALGLRVVSDVTAAGAPVTRTVVLSFDPSVAATVAAINLFQGGAIQSVTANPGFDYILPPVVTVVYPTGLGPPIGNPPLLKAVLSAGAIAISNGGGGYVAPVAKFIGGLPPANTLGALSVPDDPVKPPPKVGCVRRVYVKTPGLGYPVGTTCQIRGGGPQSSSPTIQATADVVRDAFGRITDLVLTDMGAGYVKMPQVDLVPPANFVPTSGFKPAKAFAVMAEGTPARAGVITVVANAITAIAVASAGDNYVSVPDIVITDPGNPGAGAIAIARMGVGRVDVIAPSIGVPATATVTFTPVFQRYFPSLVGGNDPNQQKPFFRLLEAALMQAGFTPVVSADPLVA